MRIVSRFVVWTLRKETVMQARWISSLNAVSFAGKRVF